VPRVEAARRVETAAHHDHWAGKGQACTNSGGRGRAQALCPPHPQGLSSGS
jgi:hypothetical protein